MEAKTEGHAPGCPCEPCIVARRARVANVFDRLAAAHDRFGMPRAAESARQVARHARGSDE